jgi:hypothetical protein
MSIKGGLMIAKPLITSAINKGDKMTFSGKVLTLIYFSLEEEIARCTLKDELLNQIHTKVFRRIGIDIKSGIDLGDCQEYIPTKIKKMEVGKEITLPCGICIVRKVLRKTKEGWLCLVSYANSTINCFLETIPF